jgi:hypothetical protein
MRKDRKVGGWSGWASMSGNCILTLSVLPKMSFNCCQVVFFCCRSRLSCCPLPLFPYLVVVMSSSAVAAGCRVVRCRCTPVEVVRLSSSAVAAGCRVVRCRCTPLKDNCAAGAKQPDNRQHRQPGALAPEDNVAPQARQDNPTTTSKLIL